MEVAGQHELQAAERRVAAPHMAGHRLQLLEQLTAHHRHLLARS
jgi:hypothetical protein